MKFLNSEQSAAKTNSTFAQSLRRSDRTRLLQMLLWP